MMSCLAAKSAPYGTVKTDPRLLEFCRLLVGLKCRDLGISYSWSEKGESLLVFRPPSAAKSTEELQLYVRGGRLACRFWDGIIDLSWAISKRRAPRTRRSLPNKPSPGS